MSQLLQNAVYGGVMILAVAVLRRVLRDRLVPEARLALWAVCLFRLLTPAAPESVLSLWGLGRWLERETAGVPAPGPIVSTPYAGGTFVPEDPAVTAPVASAAAPAEAGIPWEMLLAGLWLAVGAVLAVRFVYAYVRTRLAVGCAIPIGRDDPRYAPLPGFARLREGPVDGAPLTFGAVRPTVVLPPGLDGEKLVCVLTHEGVHARRRDNLWHYVTALALVIHWWNPAVWLMARLVRRDVELSCDRAAVKRLGADRRAEYARALVSMATMAEGPAFCQTFGRKAAEERVISIMKYKKTTVIGTALSLALVLGLTAGFASNPVEPGVDGQGGIWSVSQESPWIISWEYSADGRSLAGYSISWSQLEESLANQVTKGELTQEKADEILAWAREATRDEEGKRFRWTFDEDCGLIMENREVFYIYQDGSGNRVKIDTESFVSSFIYPMANNGISVAVELGEKTPGADAWRVSLEEYKALLDRLVADGKMSQKDADWLYAGAKQALEQAEKDGWAAAIQTNNSGGYAIMNAPLCYLTDCGNTGVHTHDGVTYRGWGNKHAIPPFCTDEACEGFAPHWHKDGGVIFYNGYGEGVELPVCPVEGCTTPGVHTHDVTVYACNGSHCGGVCDGSCFTYSQPMQSASNGNHHSESHSSGHHGNGHH